MPPVVEVTSSLLKSLMFAAISDDRLLDWAVGWGTPKYVLFAGCWRCFIFDKDRTSTLVNVASYDGPPTVWYRQGRVPCCFKCLGEACQLETCELTLSRHAWFKYNKQDRSGHAIISEYDVISGKLQVFTIGLEDGSAHKAFFIPQVVELRQQKSQEFLDDMQTTFPTQALFIQEYWTMRGMPLEQHTPHQQELRSRWQVTSYAQERKNFRKCVKESRRIKSPGHVNVVHRYQFPLLGSPGLVYQWELGPERRVPEVQQSYRLTFRIYRDAARRRQYWEWNHPDPSTERGKAKRTQPKRAAKKELLFPGFFKRANRGH